MQSFRQIDWEYERVLKSTRFVMGDCTWAGADLVAYLCWGYEWELAVLVNEEFEVGLMLDPVLSTETSRRSEV